MAHDEPTPEVLCCGPLVDHALDEGDAVALAGVFASSNGSDGFFHAGERIHVGRDVAAFGVNYLFADDRPEQLQIVGERRGRWTWWRAVPEQIAALQASLGTVEISAG